MPEVAHVLSDKAYDPDTHVFCILASYKGEIRPFFTWAEGYKDAIECVQLFRKWQGA
jgi:hypothetical protein